MTTSETHTLVAATRRLASTASPFLSGKTLTAEDQTALRAAITAFVAAESAWNHACRDEAEAGYDAALDRLIAIARRDTHQSSRVATFLLAWWNAAVHGAWDPTDLWSVDASVRADIVTCIRAIQAAPQGLYPYERREDIEVIMARHRGVDLDAASGRR